MIDFTKLWDIDYLFGPNPVDLQRSDHVFFWIMIALIAMSAIAKLFAWRQDKGSPAHFLYSRFFHLFLTVGILMLIWFGARRENIPWIGTHFVVLMILLIWLVWLVFIGKYYLQKFRIQQDNWKSEERRHKYLP